jgi:hypothetical protein
MTTASTALHLLRASRDADHDAPIWADNGAMVTRLAREAGVTVTFVHCDLTTLTTEWRVVEGKGANDDPHTL